MRIGIIGAGLTGLCSAYHLSKDHEVIVFEKTNELGGLASSFKQGSEFIPKHYHHIIKSNTKTLEYFKNFGLLGNNKWRRIKMRIAVNNKKYDFTDPLSLLRFNYLSFKERIHYGLFGLYTLFFLNPKKINPELNAYDWLVNKIGKSVTEKIFVPLYAENKFGIPLNNINAKQFATRIKSAEFKTKFTYPTKGFQSLINEFKKEILRNEGKIIKKSVIKLNAKNKVITNKKKTHKFDVIINTAPIPEFLEFTKGLPKDYSNQLRRIKYCSAISVCFGTEDFIDDHYWTNFFKERIHVLIQHSLLHDAYDTKINWVLRYGGSEQDLKLSDKEISEKYLGVIKKYFPNTKIKWVRVFREKYASPIYDMNYVKNKPEYLTPVKGLFHAGVAVTYPEVRNCNSALKSGEEISKLIKDNYY